MNSLLPECLPLLTDAPNGIQRLRDLILELAVAGRLVPQHASEETGHDLMLRIGALADGFKWSKPAGVATSQLAETAHHLPATWASAQLGEVVEIVRGITFPAAEKTKVPAQGRIACLRTSNVQDRIEWDDLLYVDEKFVGRLDQMLQVSDIVMSMANSRELVGKVALVTDLPVEKASFGGFLGVIRPVLMEPRFVMALLRTPSARRALIDGASQTTNIANISLAKLRPLPVAVPSLAEQRRIVAKVDELMALCDRLEARHQDAEAAHARLVRTLLDTLINAGNADEFQACWQRMAGEFCSIFSTEQSVLALERAVHTLALRGLLTESGGRTASGSAEGPYLIPDSWTWQTLADVTSVLTDGEHLTPQRTNDRSQIPLATAKNVRDGHIDLTDTDFVSREVAERCWSRCRPAAGDVLMVSVGATLGRLSVLREQRDMVIVRSVALFRPRGVDPDYLALALRSPLLQGEIWSRVKQSAQPGLYLSQAKQLQVPVPPLECQLDIVTRVTELLNLCNQLKVLIAAARTRHAQLAEALVAQTVAA